jgi:hypothetical protein
MSLAVKNGGKIDKELTIEEIEDGLNTFDRYPSSEGHLF